MNEAVRGLRVDKVVQSQLSALTWSDGPSRSSSWSSRDCLRVSPAGLGGDTTHHGSNSPSPSPSYIEIFSTRVLGLTERTDIPVVLAV